MNCNRCGCDEEDNDGPMRDCPQCNLSLCDHCYGDVSFEWCARCRREERNKAKVTTTDNTNTPAWPLARCDEKGHIIVRLGGCECGISDMQAIDYVLQLSEAVMVSHRMPKTSPTKQEPS